jgi:hypothetical protein
MWRPAPRTVWLAALVVVAVGSIALTHYAFTPSSVTRRTPDITLATLCLPSAVAVCFIQAIAYPSHGHRLAASAGLFVAGLLTTIVITFVLGCGFYGACSK